MQNLQEVPAMRAGRWVLVLGCSVLHSCCSWGDEAQRIDDSPSAVARDGVNVTYFKGEWNFGRNAEEDARRAINGGGSE